jgi:hypothetical protein
MKGELIVSQIKKIGASYFDFFAIIPIFVLMRKVGAALLLVIFMFGYVNLGELVKLHALISHFFVHQNSNPEINIIEYIHAHYCAEHFHCDHKDAHEELPFQHGEFHLVVVDKTPCGWDMQIACVVVQDCPQHDFYRSPRIPSVAAEIWQPPKIG